MYHVLSCSLCDDPGGEELQLLGEQACEKTGWPGTVAGLLRSAAMDVVWYQPATEDCVSLAALRSQGQEATVQRK